jgi:hypothetical protein
LRALSGHESRRILKELAMPPQNVTDINPLSKCSVHLELFFNEQSLALGTGVLARAAERTFLVTALHNFTGREPDGRYKHSELGVPNLVQITGYNFQTRLPLYDQVNNPNNDNYLFWRHPLGPKIDICALPISGVPNVSSLDPSFLDRTGHAATVRLFISQLCFVVGYPEGLFIRQSDESVLPLWKTGHIASEPSVYVDDVPKLLIDAATCEGMSGSPVYVQTSPYHRFVGIYTGRTSQISELGFVFTPEAILQIISTGPIHGRLDYPNVG